MLTAVKTKYPWEIEKNYRRCFAKSYKVHVCRPPRGVVIYNKLEHPELLSQLEGQSCITLKLQEKPILAKLALTLVKENKAYYMNGDNFVILVLKVKCIQYQKQAYLSYSVDITV